MTKYPTRSVSTMKFLITIPLMCAIALGELSAQQKLLVPMDLKQTNHLKAYGIAFWALQRGIEIDWLLNYRGGSFMLDYASTAANECRIRGVAFEGISGADAARIYAEVGADNNNMDVIRLEKTPKIMGSGMMV